MTLRDQITSDMKDAMRAKNTTALESIRMLRAAIQRREVDEQITLDDTGIVSVVEKMIKQGRESIRQFDQGNRPDLSAKEQATIDVIEKYLPERIDGAELEQMVANAIESSGAATMRDMGKVMAILKPELAGRADMGAVSAMVKARLS